MRYYQVRYYRGVDIKPHIRWKFPELLKQEGVSIYRLHQELAKKVSRTVLYKWGQEAPQRVDLDVLAQILWGLEQVKGKRFEVSDVLEYQKGESEEG